MARYASARRDLVWGGLAVTALGVVVAAYAVTGDRIYDITYAPIFVVGALLALAGSAVAAWGRTGARTRAEPLVPLEEEDAEASEGAGDDEPADAGGPEPEPAPEPTDPDAREVVVIDCPDCGNRFREEGVRPFQADCPRCGLRGRIPETAGRA